MAEKRWLPLESNPDVMNKYVCNLGVPDDWQFVDVYGFEEDLLAMVPRPVAAVLLLYPMTENTETKPVASEEGCKENENLYFIKQTIGNACGTIGLIHAIANNTEKISLSGDKALQSFLNETRSCCPAEKAVKLEKNESIMTAHELSAQEGQTEAPSRDEKIKLHFVTFVHMGGKLYQMDGRRDSPMCHGDTTPDNLLQDAAKVIKEFMARDPTESSFAVTALAKV